MAHGSNLIKRISLGGNVYEIHDEQSVHTLADLENLGLDTKATHYATCPTAADVVTKIATIQNGTFTLDTGVKVSVKFADTNSAVSPTLNINDTGDKEIYSQGTSLISKSGWRANQVVDFVYDGSHWHIVGLSDTLSWNSF